ncbi:ABC transporter permease [Nguyenibacter sp. L1]|nr:ABC transporter permease [Nguyenibacter sp. L1]
MLLSGFVFPFQGMPRWARYAGELMPTTHAVRIMRGVLLKGNGMTDILPDLWPILLFTAITVLVAVRFYRETLD